MSLRSSPTTSERRRPQPSITASMAASRGPRLLRSASHTAKRSRISSGGRARPDGSRLPRRFRTARICWKLSTSISRSIQLPSPPLEGRQVGVDGGRGPAGIAQEFSDSHDVMSAQATPAAGVRAYGPEHPGDDPEERSHGLPAAGRVQGQEVGPGRINRGVTAGRHQEEFLIRRIAAAGRVRSCSSSGIRLMSGSGPAGKRPARCVKIGGNGPVKRTAESLLFQRYILISKEKN